MWSIRVQRVVAAGMFAILGAGCTTVKEYQKAHLNDSEMELAARKIQKFETSFQLYREGAVASK